MKRIKRIILLLETSRAFGRQLIIGIARYSKLNGPWTFYKEPAELKSAIPHLTSWKPDGIIMRDLMISRELLRLKIPTILAVHRSLYPKNMPLIKTDSRAIAKMASAHFLDKGINNLAFCGYDDIEWSEERKFHFSRFNSEAGFNTHVYIPPKKVKIQTWEKEQRNVTEWIKSLPKPVGIFACNDDRGRDILEACKIINLRVPESVAVIGVDDDPLICELCDPPLTSITLNVEAAGYEAAEMLDHLIEHKKVTKKLIMVTPGQVVQRQSSDILAVNDSEVAAAVLFIKENAKNKIKIEDVVKVTTVSRRTLEKRFMKVFRRSISDEIRRVRIEYLAKLLIETNLPISQITTQFNFIDGEHISRYFKRVKGIGLREFRKLHQSAKHVTQSGYSIT